MSVPGTASANTTPYDLTTQLTYRDLIAADFGAPKACAFLRLRGVASSAFLLGILELTRKQSSDLVSLYRQSLALFAGNGELEEKRGGPYGYNASDAKKWG
jgi:hypothetical protein